MPINFSNSGSQIPQVNRTYSKVLKATKDVHKTAHKAAIISMGGVMTVASLIFNTLHAMASFSQQVSFELQAVMSKIGQTVNLTQKKYDAVAEIIIRLM